MLKKLHIWLLTREFQHHMKCLKFYIERSSFDLKVSAYDYRQTVTARRNRMKQLAESLKGYGVDVSGEGGSLKWQ